MSQTTNEVVRVYETKEYSNNDYGYDQWKKGDKQCHKCQSRVPDSSHLAPIQHKEDGKFDLLCLECCMEELD